MSFLLSYPLPSTDVKDKPRRSSGEADRVRQIEELAYDAQNVIDELSWLQQLLNRTDAPSLSSIEKICECIIPLPQIGKQIDWINGSITDISELTSALGNLNIGESSCAINRSETQCRETIPIDEDEKVIGFEDQKQKIKQMLIWKNHEPLSVISIVGMGGIGKSTLAREIFNDFDVKNLFFKRIWIGISEQYNVQINSQHVRNMTSEEVRAILIKSLKEGKCLIVIDGIWKTETWDAISDSNSIFFNIYNGSRIIKTTRKQDVARFPERINNIETEVYEVELLDKNKSQELLETRAFPSNPSKDILIRQIIQKCNGLPLALIDLRDSILSEIAISGTWLKSPDEINWEELPISESLALSYNDLPSHLKPIFLYITCFPGGGQFIKVSELIKLWIAEDFIKHDDNCQPEKTARMYVEELRKRCLVKVKRSKTYGWITRLIIHDVVRDWGREIAKNGKFLKIITRSDDLKDAKSFHRVAVHKYHVDDLDKQISKLHTLLGFHLPNKNITSTGFNSARVVKLNPSCFIQKSPECIIKMIFLQYICLQKFHKIHLPESIKLLFRLETLDCRGSSIVLMHFSLWKISTLRHLYLEDVCCNWSYPKNGSRRNIRSVYIYDRSRSSGKIGYKWCKPPGLHELVDAVEEMADIVTLGLISYAGSLHQKILAKISRLSSLEVLELREEVPLLNRETGLSRVPTDYEFPENLRKVKLGCFNLVDDPMPALGKLPRLVVLELSNVTKLNSMNSSGNSFPVLQKLKIVNFLGEELKADDGAMPYLCHLTLDGCTKLERISGKFQGHQGLTRELTNGTPLNL